MMWGRGRRNQERLDEAVSAIRRDEVSPDAEDASLARVRAGIGSETADVGGRIESCADVAHLLPLYRDGGLSKARAMLVDDHLRECVRCRDELEARGERRRVTEAWSEGPATVRPTVGHRWLAIAASVGLVAVGLSVWSWLFRTPDGPRMAVQSTSGALYVVEGSTLQPTEPGAKILEGQAVRTGQGGHAVLELLDGSLVEVDERAQVTVSARGRDTTIHLDRGNIIVQAAKRHTGHLYVATADCRVAVTGTIFSVRHGLAGSRVSVIEGEVHVAHAGEEDVLHPGEQVSTTPSLQRVPVAEDIAWSRDKERHLALLNELAVLKASWASIEEPSVRFESRLAGLVPPSAKVFMGIPNYGKAIDDAYGMFKDRLAESPVLQQWWDEEGLAEHEDAVDEGIAALRAGSDHLGDEVVVAITPPSDDGGKGGFVALAEVRQPGVSDLMATQLLHLGIKDADVRFLDGQALASAVQEDDAVYVLEAGGLLAVSPSVEALRELEARRSAGTVPFASTPLGQRVARAYAQGVGALVAVHTEALADENASGVPRFVVAERKVIGEQTHNTADVEFAEGRSGLSAWLAPSGSMGSLDFVSPSAVGAAAILLKNPNALLEETLDEARLSSVEEALSEIERETGLRVREDVLASLGGEVALAVDGPLLPTPSWKLILEVVDADALNQAIETFVARAQEMVEEPQLRLDREEVGGHLLQSVRVEGKLDFEAHFAVVDGYLVVTPSRGLLVRAIETHERGESLVRSARFASLMPAGGDAHCSGVVYHNLGVALGPIAEALHSSGQISPEAQQSLESLARSAEPSLVALYGGERHLRLAAVGSMPGLDTAGLALPSLLGRAMQGTSGLMQP